MDNDSVYRNDGAYFTDETETQNLVNQETADTFQQFPLLEEHIRYLDDKIAFYGDVDAISIDLNQKPEAHRNLVAVNKLMKSELLALKADIQARVEAALRDK